MNKHQIAVAARQAQRRGKRREPGSTYGVRKDSRLRIGFTPQLDPGFAKRMRELPEKIQQRFWRRSMRQAMTVFKRLAQPLYRRHRTSKPRKHLDESLAVVSRAYRRKFGERVLWAAVGFRTGAIGGKAYIGSGRRTGARPRTGDLEWAGWRAHFLERGFTASGGVRWKLGGRIAQNSYSFGRNQFLPNALMGRPSLSAIRSRLKAGEGRFVAGKHYLPKVFAAGRFAAQSAFDHALSSLIRTEGRRIGRLPKTILARELAELTA